jgi:ectoine hydroxylase-related dioxygenase (phytanoyl-CoA dioxygenase family)
MNEEMKEQYDKIGYVVCENLFSQKEVQALKEEARRVLDEVEKEQDADPWKIGVYVGMTARSKLFKDAAVQKELVDILRQINGPRLEFLSDKIVYKNGKRDLPSPWHQDWPYWKGCHKVSVWVALDDATIENGCLKVIPGSHLKGILKHESHGDGFSNQMKKEEIDEDQAVAVEVKAGTAIIFHDLLLHASYPNTSRKDRWALISTYRDAQNEDPKYKWETASFVIN